MTDAALTPKKVVGRPWLKGTSGNPKGKPKGTLNKSTLSARRLAQAYLNAAVEPVFQKLVEKAKEGDVQCIRLVVERILPIVKAFEEPRRIEHAIEICLKQPGWLQIPQVTIEHDDGNG
jgi:hypothetical protein